MVVAVAAATAIACGLFLLPERKRVLESPWSKGELEDVISRARSGAAVVAGRIQRLSILNAGGSHTTAASVTVSPFETMCGYQRSDASIVLHVGASSKEEYSAIRPGDEYIVVFEPLDPDTRLKNLTTGLSSRLGRHGTTLAYCFFESSDAKKASLRQRLQRE